MQVKILNALLQIIITHCFNNISITVFSLSFYNFWLYHFFAEATSHQIILENIVWLCYIIRFTSKRIKRLSWKRKYIQNIINAMWFAIAVKIEGFYSQLVRLFLKSRLKFVRSATRSLLEHKRLLTQQDVLRNTIRNSAKPKRLLTLNI